MAIREFRISGVRGMFPAQVLEPPPPPPPPASTLNSGGADKPPLNVYIVSRFILAAVFFTGSKVKIQF